MLNNAELFLVPKPIIDDKILENVQSISSNEISESNLLRIKLQYLFARIYSRYLKGPFGPISP
jgi:hypothetical protein